MPRSRFIVKRKCIQDISALLKVKYSCDRLLFSTIVEYCTYSYKLFVINNRERLCMYILFVYVCVALLNRFYKQRTALSSIYINYSRGQAVYFTIKILSTQSGTALCCGSACAYVFVCVSCPRHASAFRWLLPVQCVRLRQLNRVYLAREMCCHQPSELFT